MHPLSIPFPPANIIAWCVFVTYLGHLITFPFLLEKADM